MAEELHVLFGGGQVGHPLSRILLGCGKRVRIVKRSAGGLPDGVELGHDLIKGIPESARE